MFADFTRGRNAHRSRLAAVCLVLPAAGALSGAYCQKNYGVEAGIAAAEAAQNQFYCSLNGRVTSVDGEPLADATVEISAALLPARRTVADADGRFAIAALPPGTFTVRVLRDGFASARGTVRLAPEANTATVNFALRPAASESVSVTATEEEIAEAQMHLAEQQRVAGILPNFFVSYMWQAVPLSPGRKFRLALKNASDPGNLLLVGTVAGVQQAGNAFQGYGQGAKGYGRRYGADLGNLVSGTFLGGAIYPSLFRQDPRYFYKGEGSPRARFWYAISRTMVTRGDNGHPEFNYSTVLGDMSAGALSNLYYAREDRRGAKVTVVNGLLGIAGDAMNNVFQEFVLKKLTTNSRRNTIRP